MASSKRKTTMNKLNRERKLQERRVDKQAKKVARANNPDIEEVPYDPFNDGLARPSRDLYVEEPIPLSPTD